MMKFDDILKEIGEFGNYQKFIYILVCLPTLFLAINNINIVFFLYTPKHRCKIPDYENDTYTIQSKYHQILVDKHIPKDGSGNGYHACAVYDLANSTVKRNYTELKGCNSWVYDRSVFVSTFTTKENLVCDNAGYTAHVTMLVFAGDGIGAFIQGMISDRIGRKKMLIGGLSLLSLFGIGLAWSPNAVVFTALKLITEMVGVGVYTASFVLSIEIVGPSKRRIAGIGFSYFYAFGLMLSSGVGYALRDWHHIALISAAPCLFFLIYFWIVPESPRWLKSKGHQEEAFTIVHKIAKANKTLHKLDRMGSLENETEEQNPKRVYISTFFKSKSLLKKSLIIFTNWFAVYMCYYGLILNISNLSGNYYLNFLITALVELPAYTLCFLLMDLPKIGRKKLYIASMVVGGIAMLCSIIPTLLGKQELSVVPTALSMVGKTGLSAAYALIYIWSAELFPTVVRNTGLGLASTSGCVGTLVSPYIADLSKHSRGHYGKVFSLITFGLITIFAGLLTIGLPETLNQNLPDDVADMDQTKAKHQSTSDQAVREYLCEGDRNSI